VERSSPCSCRTPKTPASRPRPERISPDVLPSAPLKHVRVLVVDDEADGRDATSRLLERCGASTASAGSVNEALEAILADPPDVVLADIGMPVEDGYAPAAPDPRAARSALAHRRSPR
jgi:PleD family two-component response regulator